MTEPTPEAPLFHEIGSSWAWVLAGPFAALLMLGLEINVGLGPRPLVPLMFLVLVSGFLAVQVKAARVHTSVELTRETLRQGTEVIGIDEIVQVLPAQDLSAGAPLEKWQSARALGELRAVPRRRTGIGLKLTHNRMAQAWALRHRELRALLTELVEQRAPEAR